MKCGRPANIPESCRSTGLIVRGLIVHEAGIMRGMKKNPVLLALGKNVSQLRREKEFTQEQLAERSVIDPSELGKRLARKKIKYVEVLVPDRDIDFSTKEGKEMLRQTKAWVNQDFFRDMVLLDYETQCCVTGLNIPGVLRASHIVGWAEDKEPRLNPANGLCLSATYDAAFDRHLISFDEDYRMIFSPSLKEYYSNKAFKLYFTPLEGRQISFPKRYIPDQNFLARHRNRLCT